MNRYSESLAARMVERTCPACGHHVAFPFLEPGTQPLATLAWPTSAEEARSMPRVPLEFVRCVNCGHVYNAAFDYALVPYSDKPNLMFNRGTLWSVHLRAVIAEMARRLPERPTVIEIGHGDGSLIGNLAQTRPGGRFIGFDPHGATESDNPDLEFRAALFQPGAHIPALRPDLIISRHVLEHLTNPLGFVQQLSFAAACVRVATTLYIEVPCVDRAIETGRTVDFYFEHNSHFTTESFTRMLDRCGVAVDAVRHGYDGEVVYAFARLGSEFDHISHAREAAMFAEGAREAETTISAQLADLHHRGLRVAVWGGTGKSAAFINRFGMDAERFPTVVDSDAQKAGTFVPGTGQEIRFRDYLLEHPVDVILIPPQWRARDILGEMDRAGIRCASVLIEHEGRLVDFHRDPHPYAASRAVA